MKIYLLLIIPLCLSACSKVEKVVVKYDNNIIQEKYTVLKSDKEIKEGTYIRNFESGQLMEEASYVEGKLNGRRQLYFSSGGIEIIEHYTNDTFNGPYQSFFESGNISSEGQYEDNFMVGPWKFYYDLPNKAIKEEVSFLGNIENGPFKEFYENGNIKTIGTYKDEIEDDLLKEYDEDGNLIKEIFYKDGKMIKFKSFDADGEIIKDEDYSEIWGAIESNINNNN